MTGKRIEKSWTWHLRASREALWPLISDTERMNEALRLPRYRLRQSVDEDGIRRRHGEYDDDGAPMRWEEIPFEWSTGHWWRWDRLYETGPLERARGTLVMEADNRGGTVATYTLVAEPRNVAGAALARTGHLAEAGKAFERLLKLADAHARKPQGDFYANLAATRTRSAKRRKASGYTVPPEIAERDRAVAQQLLDWLAAAFESDLREIRAKRVARALGIEADEAHRALVLGVEMGAVERRFRLHCSTCRGVVREEALPRALPLTTACPHCTAPVETNYARNVEVIFTPHSAIRDPSPLVHCASGPGVWPRIVLQQTLDPHERRDLPARLAKGAYVIRKLDAEPRFEFEAEGGKGAMIRAGDAWIEVPETTDTLVFENHGERVATIIVERADWPPEATSLAEWLTYQRCRETTPPDTLHPDLSQDGGTLSIVIVSSREGDVAGNCRKLARAHGGAVVEDTGSGILMAFARNAPARRAMDAALQIMPAARIGADHGPLTLIADAHYAGEARDRVADLAGLAQEGVPNLSPSFRARLEL